MSLGGPTARPGTRRWGWGWEWGVGGEGREKGRPVDNYSHLRITAAASCGSPEDHRDREEPGDRPTEGSQTAGLAASPCYLSFGWICHYLDCFQRRSSLGYHVLFTQGEWLICKQGAGMLKGRLVLAETLQCLSFNMPRELLLCILMRICTYVCGHVGVYTCIQVLKVMVQRLRNNRYISNGKKSKHSESITAIRMKNGG